MVSRRLTLLTCCALLLPLAACSSTVRRPRLLHPGPAGYQQANAEEFDPYPQNDVGPEILGGRPPDYQIPPNEVTRARQQQPVGPWRSAVPVAAPIAAPVTPPVIPAPVSTPVTPPITYPTPVPVPVTRY
jgi:hypothetical protein